MHSPSILIAGLRLFSGWFNYRRHEMWLVVVSAWWVVFSATVFPAGAGTAEFAGGSNLVSIAELQTKLAGQGRVIGSFQIEGLVGAAVPGRNVLALCDGQTSVLFEVPSMDERIRPGDWVRVSATNCALTQSRFGIQLGTAPVVNNDGHHGTWSKAGEAYLEAGWQPIRLTWFNGAGLPALQLEYAGPGLTRQRVSGSAYGHRSAEGDFKPGLDFAAYLGDWRSSTPDFPHLAPVAQGVAADVDLRYSARQENTALSFSGFIKIPSSGSYTFFLSSEDGSCLYVGNPAAACEVTVLAKKSAPVPLAFQEAVQSGNDHLWTQMAGHVDFVSQNEGWWNLEVTGKAGSVPVEIIDSGTLCSTNLRGQDVMLTGILERFPNLGWGGKARLVVPGAGQVSILATGQAAASNLQAQKILTSAKEIRDLTPAEARLRRPARIRGVVTWCSPIALVLQDKTGGVFVHYYSEDWPGQPRIGDAWEIEGVTDPGDFSPVIMDTTGRFFGNAVMPEPIRPTWDQLLNGSLDAEYVEVRGALTEVSPVELTLLTAEGKIVIQSSDDHPLPYLPPLPDGESYLNSIVRIRACFTAHWDPLTRQVREGFIWLSPGTVEVEEFAPPHPFAIPAKRLADLLLFDPNANVLRRTKVAGQIILESRGEDFLQDGAAGLRLHTKTPLNLEPGEAVEAIGFLQIEGPSPTLQEAQVRTSGRSALPLPVTIAGAELRNGNHDSTRVQTVAMLVSDRWARGQRVLEMQAGQNHFVARLDRADTGTALLTPGSRLRLTGVYVSQGDGKADGNLDAFELGMTSAADIEVLARPPWWTLRRALGMVAALLGVLAMAAIWITLLRRQIEERTWQLQKQIEERQLVEQRRVMEQERTRVAQDLHDELGAGLTEVGLLGDLAKNPAVPAPEKQQYLGQLTEIARSLVTSLDAIVWAINPHYDSVASLASYCTLYAQRFLNLAGVACRPQLPAAFPDYSLDPKGRHGIFLAFKEALNNVVRHAGAKEVRLKIEVKAGDLIISVADDGRGFETAAGTSAGEGLPGMRQRMEQLRGSCHIRSRPGDGTEVEFRFPIELEKHMR